MGLEWDEDGAGPTIGSTAGNVLCRLPGSTDGGVPIFLCAHFDTVPLDGELEPVVGEDGVVRNAGGTILGADDKSALAVMVEATRRIVEERRPHAGVELLFTPMEEIGLVGRGRLRRRPARRAARLRLRPGRPHRRRDHRLSDGAGARADLRGTCRPRRHVSRGRPLGHRRGGAGDRGHAAGAHRPADERQRGARARRHGPQRRGRALHARGGGALPRRSPCDRGRPTDPRCRGVRREHVRLHARDQDRAKYRGYRFRDDDLAVRLAVEALDRAGFRARLGLSGGAADANVFNAAGLQCVNLANGMLDIHTADERISVDDLERMVDVTLALVDVAREVG